MHSQSRISSPSGAITHHRGTLKSLDQIPRMWINTAVINAPSSLYFSVLQAYLNNEPGQFSTAHFFQFASWIFLPFLNDFSGYFLARFLFPLFPVKFVSGEHSRQRQRLSLLRIPTDRLTQSGREFSFLFASNVINLSFTEGNKSGRRVKRRWATRSPSSGQWAFPSQMYRSNGRKKHEEGQKHFVSRFPAVSNFLDSASVCQKSIRLALKKPREGISIESDRYRKNKRGFTPNAWPK